MAIIEIHYTAKCKHCFHVTVERNLKNKKQAFCTLHKKFTKMSCNACENFKL